MVVEPGVGEPFGKTDLLRRGFDGFQMLQNLSIESIPRAAGVYVVLRGLNVDHQALERSGGGWFKGKDPSVDVGLVAQRLVCPSDTLYIGKADSGVSAGRGLQKRVTELMRFGEERLVAHWGGRYLWQLSDSERLRVAWVEVGDAAAREVEDALLTEFFNFYGQLPFANLRR